MLWWRDMGDMGGRTVRCSGGDMGRYGWDFNRLWNVTSIGFGCARRVAAGDDGELGAARLADARQGQLDAHVRLHPSRVPLETSRPAVFRQRCEPSSHSRTHAQAKALRYSRGTAERQPRCAVFNYQLVNSN